MHSFISCLMHCVWATKERRPLITAGLQERLWPYLGGIARENDMRAFQIGGVTDHIHMLVSVPGTLPVSKAIQLLKGNSSKWIHETFPDSRWPGWQEGYGAFSVSISGVEHTIRYICGQAEHHRQRSFSDELEVFLKRHGMQYVREDLE